MSYIFLHGLGQNQSNWKETIDEMSKDLHIDCPNLFGLCENELSYDNLYSAFSNYCEMHSEPFDICGLSLGGILALNYAIDNPHKVRSLVLIGTQYRIPKNIMKFQNIIFRFMPRKVFNKMGLSKKQLLGLTKSMTNLNFEHDLCKITCPVLVICGARDNTNMKSSVKLKTLLSNSKLEVIQNAGHEVNVDNPKALSEALKKFYTYQF